MKKRLSCRDVGADCDFVACGNSEEEIFRQAAEHARIDHNIIEMPEELREKARLAIRDVDQC